MSSDPQTHRKRWLGPQHAHAWELIYAWSVVFTPAGARAFLTELEAPGSAGTSL